MKKIEGGITQVRGFQAAGAACGIKKNGNADMAMIYSETSCRIAGTFTTNVVKAAPVIWDKKAVSERGTAKAVVINSGVANACTGELGLSYCQKTADACADALQIDADDVLVASTGVIGVQLPIEKITAGVSVLSRQLKDSTEAGHAAAQAIMTTDTVPKETAVSFTMQDGTEITVGGMCKGSGMIHPNMCTMLAFIGTDLAIAQPLLQKALSAVIPDTFNMVSVDGDTSTNDTCLLLANGLAENSELTEENADYAMFVEALREVCETLGKKMAKDGEGATCLFQCDVVHAATKEDARILARSVVSSTLTKAAVAGHDANWGRILCALGYSGVKFDPNNVDLTIESSAGKLLIFTGGSAADYSEEVATEILSQDEIIATADFHAGDASASAWGCDLTHEYVNINADYRS